MPYTAAQIAALTATVPNPVTIPHLASPLSLAADGTLTTLEQDSDTEIQQCVRALLGTSLGERLDQPDYGITDPTGSQAGATALLASAAIDTWEPRAAGSQISVTPMPDGTLVALVKLPPTDHP